MNVPYPTRNTARHVMEALVNLYGLKSNTYGVVSNDFKCQLTAKTILWYSMKQNRERVTFLFTNAVTDIYEDMGVDEENRIDTSVLMKMNFKNGQPLTIQALDEYFLESIGTSMETFMLSLKNISHTYAITDFIIDDSIRVREGDIMPGPRKFIPQLLAAYQSRKRIKGMLFQESDIKQMAIDYSIFMIEEFKRTYNYITENICKDLIKLVVNATNMIHPIKYEFIEDTVMADIKDGNSVDIAIRLIRSFVKS